MYLRSPGYLNVCWDTHADNFKRMREQFKRFSGYALLERTG